MIVGMGIDLCLITRMEDVITRHGDAFLHRVFSPEECDYVNRFKGKARFGGYAKRWAAKEACVKAMGTGFTQGVFFKDIIVRRNEKGAPALFVSGGAEAAFHRLVPSGYRGEFLVSLSDDPPFALAQVLIQVIPC